MRAIFWADCGAGVGLGHVGRTAAVASACRAAGGDVAMVVPEARGEDLIAGEGLPPAAVASFHEFVSRCARDRADVAVVDSYRLPTDAGSMLRNSGRILAAFDDDGGDVLKADVVINGAPGADGRARERRPGARYLLGPSFFPLRRAVTLPRGPRAIPDDVGLVVATAGGEDVHGRLHLMVEAAREVFASARIVAAPGASLAAELARADVAICGGGQTLVEAAALGTPAAAVLLGEDQRPQRAAVIAAGAAVDAGAWDRPAELRSALAAALRTLAAAATRRAVSEAGRALVDGRGAARIAAALSAVAAAQPS